MQFRNVVEVHPVNTGQEGKRDKNRSDDREHLHHAVHLVAQLRKVQILKAGKRIAVVFNHIHDLDDMIVQIPQKQLG